MTRAPTRGGEGEILPRYVFFEPLLAQARVLEVGAVHLTAGRSARFLRNRGATTVLALDDAASVNKAQADGSLSHDGLEFRDGDYDQLPPGQFDLIFLHQAAPLIAEHHRLAVLKRLLTANGRIVLVLRQNSGLALSDLSGGPPSDAEASIAELTGLLTGTFRSVETSTQAVFFGYSITPKDVAAPETSLDESLTDADATPAYHLFLCGFRPAELTTIALTPLSSTLMREILRGLPAPLPAPPATPKANDPFGLANELESDLDTVRMQELESRTQAAIEAAEKAELTAAMALAERDHLASKLKTRQNAESPELAAEVDTSKLEIERLQKELHDAQEELKALTEQMGTRAQQVDDHSEAADSLKERAEQATALAQTLREQVAPLSAQVEKLETELADALGRLERETFAKNALEEKLQSASSDELEAQLTTLQHDVETLEKKLAEAEEDKRKIEMRAIVAEKSRDELTGRVNKAEEARTLTEVKLATAEQEAKDLAERLREVGKESVALEEKCKQLEEQLQTSKTELSAIPDPKLLDEEKAKVAALETLRQELSTQRDELSAQLKTQESAADRVRQELTEVQESCAALKARIERADERKEKVEAERDAANRESKEILDKLTTLLAERDELKGELAKVGSRANDAEEASDELSDKMRELIARNESLTEQVRLASERAAALETERDTLRERRKSLEAERLAAAEQTRSDMELLAQAEARAKAAEDARAELEAKLRKLEQASAH
ncbi:MAG: hypothetical protein ACT4TC_24915 [Myxococcaceae bacterium]